MDFGDCECEGTGRPRPWLQAGERAFVGAELDPSRREDRDLKWQRHRPRLLPTTR